MQLGCLFGMESFTENEACTGALPAKEVLVSGYLAPVKASIFLNFKF